MKRKAAGKGLVDDDVVDVKDPVILEAIGGLDREDKMTRHAINSFLKSRLKALKEKVPEDTVIKKIRSKEALRSVVQCHKARVQLEAAKRRASLAESRFDIAKRQLLQDVSEYEDVDPEEEFSLNIFQRLILKTSTNEKEEAVGRLIEFAKAMAEKPDRVKLNAISEGAIPDNLERVIKAAHISKELLVDYADYLLEAGREGSEVAAKIFRDKKAAVRCVENDKSPAPLAAFAGLVLKNRENEEAESEEEK